MLHGWLWYAIADNAGGCSWLMPRVSERLGVKHNRLVFLIAYNKVVIAWSSKILVLLSYFMVIIKRSRTQVRLSSSAWSCLYILLLSNINSRDAGPENICVHSARKDCPVWKDSPSGKTILPLKVPFTTQIYVNPTDLERWCLKIPHFQDFKSGLSRMILLYSLQRAVKLKLPVLQHVHTVYF